MKKILLSLIAAFLVVFSYAQQDASATKAIPHIRNERKELKREHIADHGQQSGDRIHRGKRELRHQRDGKVHDWKRNRQQQHRPVNRGNGPHRPPMMDHRHK